MGWFDVHAHLTDERLASEEQAVLARARAAGLTTIISNGLNPVDNARTLALSRRDALVKPAFGFYPVDAVLSDLIEAGHEAARNYPRDVETHSADDAIDWIEKHLEEAFAVGEIGLDGYWVPEAHWAKQEDVFRRLVMLAMEADKAIIIHTRKREARAFEILCEMHATKVDWHCFGGKVKLARRIAEQGHYFSIPANARRSQSFTRMLETLPRERILLETDSPYLAPTAGDLNEPANVVGTARYAAELWGCDLGDVAEIMAENFSRLFGCPP